MARSPDPSHLAQPVSKAAIVNRSSGEGLAYRRTSLSAREESVRRHVSEICDERVKIGLAKHRLIEPGHLLL